MRSNFPLFQSHLDLAHSYWERLVDPGDIVFDATCGNGQDTLKLAKLALDQDQGMVYGCDINAKAIKMTLSYLSKNFSTKEMERIKLIHGCHSQFPSSLQEGSIKLIVYNLGYLPGGGDKTNTTQTKTTLESLLKAQDLLTPGGAISITCYPGHVEGENEENAILLYAQGLPKDVWSCCYHKLLNRNRAPSLLLLQKAHLPQYGNTIKDGSLHS